MKKEYYDLLGVTEFSSDEEIKAQYEALKAKYKEERWLEGEAGNEAAKMLNKLDVAYGEIIAYRKEQSLNTSGQSSFEEVENLIREGKYTEAQNVLDSFSERNAEWHVWQANIYDKKEWHHECKKQFEIALAMEPDNEKIKRAYEIHLKNMEAKKARIDREQKERENREADASYNPAGFNEPMDQMGGNACSDCLSWCTTCLCANMCFNLCCGCN